MIKLVPDSSVIAVQRVTGIHGNDVVLPQLFVRVPELGTTFIIQIVHAGIVDTMECANLVNVCRLGTRFDAFDGRIENGGVLRRVESEGS